ncbi:5'-3' exonuclease PLD3 [Labeo rohita]|uniref:5'-3' exonuclease PLD3 n=1 Tax=Labeo rohita TaxID=84645 RepID=A0ABQ8LT88_LABRO|nr:5'-3' exonuclease PLD3 [Labeo rohita]
MKSDIPYEKYYRCLIILTSVTTVLLILLSLQSLLVPTTTSSSSKSSGRQEHFLIRETCTDPCSGRLVSEVNHSFTSAFSMKSAFVALLPSIAYVCVIYRIVLVESIPEGLVFNSSTTHQSIYEAWLNLISGAQSSLDIASFYWTLTNDDTHTHEATANQGEQILQELGQLSGKVSVRIAVDKPSERKPMDDIKFLTDSGADVRMVNMRELTSGVLHTKFWIVKELGAVVYDCSCLAKDLGKIFEAYWYLSQTKTVPAQWPEKYSTLYNKDTPMQLSLNGTDSSVYLSSSPPSLCAEGRTPDLQSVLSVIADAQQFVYIAVMNYLPTMEYSSHKRSFIFPTSSFTHTCWDSTNPIMIPFLRSLASLQDKSKLDVQVRLFTVPTNPRQKQIPYARVNHNKYMVTDKVAYIGTSNWSGDYFVNTAGSALVVNQTSAQSISPTVQEQLQAVFERDWESSYSTDINHRTNRKDIC